MAEIRRPSHRGDAMKKSRCCALPIGENALAADESVGLALKKVYQR